MGVRSGPGRSPRRLRLLARYGADNDFSSVGGAEKWKGKSRVARYSSSGSGETGGADL